MGFLSGSVSSNKSQQSGSTSGTGTTTQTLTGGQSDALGGVGDLIKRLLANPAKSLEPLQTGAINKVNAGYASTVPSLRASLLSSGGDSSGKFGLAAAGANQARMGQIANTNTEFAQKALDQQSQGASLAMQLLSHIFGSSTAQTGTSQQSGSGSSTQFGGGTSLGFSF